jgi:hypothetical protein
MGNNVGDNDEISHGSVLYIDRVQSMEDDFKGQGLG